MQSAFHHTYGAFHNLVPGSYHGRSLLSSQHGMSDLRCIGQMGNTRLHDLDTGDDQTLCYFFLQRPVDLIEIRAEGNGSPLVLEMIVWIRGGQLTHGRIRLDHDEFFIAVYFKNGFESIADLPYEDNTDHDGIAHLVIYFYFFAFKIPGAQRQCQPLIKWVDPEKSAFLDTALVSAK